MLARMTPTATRSYILAFGAVVATLYVWALSGWNTYSHEGTLGAQFGPRQASLESPIVHLAPGSPLSAAGAKEGDSVRYDHPRDARRYLGAGEVVGLQIVSGGASRHVDVTAGPAPPAFFTSGFGAILTALVSALAVAIGLVIGLRRADHPSILFFAMAILMQPLNYANRRIPPGPIADFLDVMNPLVPFSAIYFCFACFCLTFPDTAMGTLRSRLRKLLVPLAVVATTIGLWGTGNVAGWIHAPWTRAFEVYSISCVILSLTGLALALREATGAMRTRIAWILASMGLVYLSYLWGNVVGLLGLEGWARSTQWASASAIAAGYFGLAYALLRHRLFDIGFVMNRALVYGAVSAVMLLAFGLLEWLSHKVVHFESQQQNAFLDAGIALAVFLAFNKVHHRAESTVERLFFHAWHVREEALRTFVRRAAHIATPDALVEAFHEALASFTQGAASAVYLHEADGTYRAHGASSVNAGPIARDDPLAVALRTEPKPLHLEDVGEREGFELALPMSHRGDVNGIVLLGRRPAGESYRPDEIELLGFAAHQVGLDLHALEVESLRHALADAGIEIARAEAKVEALRSVIAPGAAPAE